MSSKELAELDDREAKFVECLFANGGNIRKAGEEAGFHPQYSYKLKQRLGKAIAQAAEEYLGMQSMKAAVKLVETIDAEMPNPIHLSAAQAVLDRVGITKKSTEEAAPIIKANIFILPEKRTNEIIDVTPI